MFIPTTFFSDRSFANSTSFAVYFYLQYRQVLFELEMVLKNLNMVREGDGMGKVY